MDKKKLANLRDKLDSVDLKLVELIAKRIAITKDVGSLKLKDNLPQYDPRRWKEASESREKIANELGAPAELVSELFDTIHEYVLDEIYRMPHAYYLGPEGSFSHEAAKALVSEGKYRLQTCSSWQELWEKLHKGKGSVAVAPIENSITSNVHSNVDVLFEGNFNIAGEGYLQINLGLFAKPGTAVEHITDVYSHPQALAQAKKLLNKNGWQSHETASTSAAVNQVIAAHSKNFAALAPIGSSQEGAECILKNAQDVSENQTRFIIATSQASKKASGTKASVIVETSHKVGSLERLLKDFSAHKFNLSKIESRPIPGKTWSYQFWIDLILPDTVEQSQLDQLLSSLATLESFRILGLYEAGKII